MGGMLTMRRGLENSVNLVTAHLLEGGISADPEKSLDGVCATAVAAKIFLHERVDPHRWMAALLVAAGVALLAA